MRLPPAARTLLVIAALVGGLASSEEIDLGKRQFFEKQIRPLLARRCFECHGPDTDQGEGGLRLDSLAGMLLGGDSGPAIRPGEPKASLLVLAINHDPSVTGMPPKTRLGRQEISLLSQWVGMGAPWPNAKLPTRPQNDAGGGEFTPEERSFWAFQPVVKPPLPAVTNSEWALASIDMFVLAGLEAAQLHPAPAADSRTLIRRATFDLLGIPPTADEVSAFEQESLRDPQLAFRKLIDRLLASPRYGERWGRHWLDVARYADSNGMDDNMSYVDAWRYRDYVIAAFNKDKPYDQFAREQIAGDLIGAEDAVGWDSPYEGLTATGLLMIGPKMLAEDDPVKQQMDIIDDQIDTIGRAFIGLTLGCARCHDHKFDPIRMADYYALAGTFKSTRAMLSYRVDSKWNSRALGDAEQEQRLEQLERSIDELDEAVVLGNFVGKESEKKRLAEQLAKAKREYAAIPKVMAAEDGPAEDLQLFLRGNHLTRGPVARRGFPRVFTHVEQASIDKQDSGRLELANWLAHPRHPLTARVMVNRVWQAHFGRGLVRSPDNFGSLGRRPDHPQLLDWLAATFVEQGWSIKELHRAIMLSQTYQMSTRYDSTAAEIDPENKLLWRMNRRRMEAEVVRDSLLAMADQLDLSIGGPALPNDKTLVILSGAAVKDPSFYASDRRSVYLPVLRSGLYDMFQAFDFPDPAVVSGGRSGAVSASQALFMMNGELTARVSGIMAEHLLAGHDRFEARVNAAYEAAFSRPASAVEMSDWREFFNGYKAAVDDEEASHRRHNAWQSFCRVVLSSNEFVFVD